MIMMIMRVFFWEKNEQNEKVFLVVNEKGQVC